MSAGAIHRLNGLEPDNLLAVLALLGAVRALAHAQPTLRPRVSWTLDELPLRPQLHLALPLKREALAQTMVRGVEQLAPTYDFDGRTDLNYTQQECRHLLWNVASAATAGDRMKADLLAALMSDAAIKDSKDGVIDPTPLCLLFGQGHQHFLQRLAAVPRLVNPPPRGRGKQAVVLTPVQSICEALFEVWQRIDPTPSFRWDPAEDVRYATMGGDPTDPAFKAATQHGANLLAVIGLPLLSLSARHDGARVRPVIAAGRRKRGGTFSMAWPVWRLPMTLDAIAALLRHPDLYTPRALDHLGVAHVLEARRISVGKFMNFTRARPLVPASAPPTPSPS